MMSTSELMGKLSVCYLAGENVDVTGDLKETITLAAEITGCH
jgi:hypothetical protein